MPLETLFWSRMESPVGALYLLVSDRGLSAISFRTLPMLPKTELIESPERTQAAEAQLAEYFRRERRDFDLALDIRGTAFQKRCWNQLMRIPYGRTCSYAELAQAVGCAAGFRAVGQANHHNPIPIIIPCHRVIAADRTLAGYGGGLDVKRKLLELEGASFKETTKGGSVQSRLFEAAIAG